jgi:hypothetical protein
MHAQREVSPQLLSNANVSVGEAAYTHRSTVVYTQLQKVPVVPIQIAVTEPCAEPTICALVQGAQI